MPLAPLSLSDLDDRRSLPLADLKPSSYPLHLELQDRPNPFRWLPILCGSLAIHLVLFFFATKLPTFRALREPPAVATHVIPLYIPRDILTQKEPNKGEVTKHIDLDALLNAQGHRAQAGAPEHVARRFEMPKTQNAQARKAPVQIMPEAPSVNAPVQTAATPLPGAVNGLAAAPPPPTPSAGPFQNLGAPAPPVAHPTLTPKATVQSALNGLTQSGAGRNIVLSDDQPSPGAPPTPGTLGQTGAQHTGVELKSDPQGVDMRPYLAKILTIVRGNWRRVIPESVRMGTMRGRTVVEFIISRDGSIPKLVTAESSGLDPLDRAAVAGLSMSNPLPPLPDDFKGQQVRLAFTFAYNMAAE